MTENNPDRIVGTITVTVLPQANGQYVCQMSSSLRDREDTRCYGQTQEHAIANALERLADEYRQLVEAQQSGDWNSMERSLSGEVIEKRYHVILHYERIAEDESKFEAMHNTLLGNTVVENAKIAVIEIDGDLQIEPLMRSWE